MRIKIFALGIVTILIFVALAGCTGDGGLSQYRPSNVLSNIIDSTRAENVIVEMPLKVTVKIEANKGDTKTITTTMADYDCNNYTVTYTASIVPLDASDTTGDSDYAPKPLYADDNTVLQAVNTFMPQRLRIGEENGGLGSVYSGDSPLDLNKIVSSVQSFDIWQDIFGGIDNVLPSSSLSSIIGGNKVHRDAGQGGLSYKLDTLTFNLQGQTLAAKKTVHIIELPINIVTNFKNINKTLLDRPNMRTSVYIPVPGIGIYATTGHDISNTYEFYPEIKYLAPLGIIDRGFLDINIQGSEAVATDWIYYVKKEEISLVENWVRVGTKVIGDAIAISTFGFVDLTEDLYHDEERPVTRSKMTESFLDKVTGNTIVNHLTDSKFVDKIKALGERSFIYELIPGGKSNTPGLLGAPGFGTPLLIAAVSLLVLLGYKRRR